MLAAGPLEFLAKALCKVLITVNHGCEALAVDCDSVVEIHDVLLIRFLGLLGLHTQAA
jgi:hypothetical protein